MLEQLKEVLSGLKRVKLLTWLSLAIGTAVLIVIGAWLSSWGFKVVQDWANLQQNPTDATKKQFDASLEIAKAIVGSIGTLATIVGGIILYLNFRVANRNAELTESRLITERFSKAVEQLGSDKIEVRLGGIYALERIANDSERDHWTIMEVLTAFVREKSPVETVKPKAKKSFVEHHLQQSETEELEVSQLAKQLTKDVQAALTVIGRRDGKKDKGKYLDLNNSNLSGADLSQANLNHAYLANADLSHADLRQANLNHAYLANADLNHAYLSYSDLSYANLSYVDLSHAEFLNTNLSHAGLRQANLSHAYLLDANLSHAYLRQANLLDANLLCAKLDNAFCLDANLSHADLSQTNLSQAKELTEEQLKTVRLCKTIMPDGTISDRDCEELVWSEESL